MMGKKAVKLCSEPGYGASPVQGNRQADPECKPNF